MDKPLLTFQGSASGAVGLFPIVSAEFLDRCGKVISTFESSGCRQSWPGISCWYAVDDKMPTTEPSTVRFRVRDEGYKETVATYSWADVQDGKARVPLITDQPLRLLVLDDATGKPIRGAKAWGKSEQSEAVTDENGKLSLPKFDPIAWECSVGAAGYASKKQRIAGPAGSPKYFD